MLKGEGVWIKGVPNIRPDKRRRGGLSGFPIHTKDQLLWSADTSSNFSSHEGQEYLVLGAGTEWTWQKLSSVRLWGCRACTLQRKTSISWPAQEPTKGLWFFLMQVIYIGLQHRNYVLVAATTISWVTSVAATDIFFNEMYSKRRQLFSIVAEWDLSFVEIHCSQLISGSCTNRQRASPLFLDFFHMLARLSCNTWLGKQGNTILNRLDL